MHQINTESIAEVKKSIVDRRKKKNGNLRETKKERKFYK